MYGHLIELSLPSALNSLSSPKWSCKTYQVRWLHIQRSVILLRIECLFHDPSLSAPQLPLGSLIYYSSVYFTSAALPSWHVFELAKHTGPSAALHCGSLCPDRISSRYPQGSRLPPGFHWNITFTVKRILPFLQKLHLLIPITLPPSWLHF